MASLLLLAACGGSEVRGFKGRIFGTTYSIKYLGGPSVPAVKQAVASRLAEIDAVFSTFDPKSEICRFNAHRSLEPFAVSAELGALVRQSLLIAEKTDGAFDPTVLPLVNLYGFGPQRVRRPPTAEEIEKARGRVGFRKLRVRSDRSLQKTVPDLELDLSGIAKGHGVDEVDAVLFRLGIESSMVEIGGEVRCRGEKAPGEPWLIGIERPSPGVGKGAIIEKVALRDAALATSGSYRRFIVAGGHRLHHILDPRTGRNAKGPVVSVSVRARTCALADGLATAFMVLGPGPAERICRAFAGRDLRLLYVLKRADGRLETEGIRWR